MCGNKDNVHIYPIIFGLVLVFVVDGVVSLSAPPQDPDWPGWWCSGSYLGEQGVKCVKVLPDRYSVTEGEAGPICATEKRSGDLLTPTLLSIESKEDEDLAVSSIMWGAYLWEGGSTGVWVSKSSYRDRKLEKEKEIVSSPVSEFTVQKDTSSATSTTRVRRNVNNTNNPEEPLSSQWIGRISSWADSSNCGELRIDVASHGSLGQPSGYGFNPSNISWVGKSCRERSRVVCQTKKFTMKGLLETITRQKDELAELKKKLGEAEVDLGKVRDGHCGVDPRNRVECGWGGIKQWQCVARGCCYDASVAGVKWCFKKVTDRSKFV